MPSSTEPVRPSTSESIESSQSTSPPSTHTLPTRPPTAQLTPPSSSHGSTSHRSPPTSSHGAASVSTRGTIGSSAGPTLYQQSSVASSKSSVARSFKSPSASSTFYFIKKPPMGEEGTMPLGENADPEAVKEFLELAAKREIVYKPTKRRAYGWKIFWFLLILCIIYFVFIGIPLWDGLVYKIWLYVKHGSNLRNGFLIFFLWGSLTAILPLFLVKFEKNLDDYDPENPPPRTDASETALLIPAYKAAGALPETIQHALKIFKPNQIFILANGPSPTPLDNTEEVCKEYGVNHAWIPVGSKIVAEFVGVMLAKKFKYALLIDDDVHLPPNLPIVTDRISETKEYGATVCIGYSIKSTGANGSKGTLIQQAQDLEYKLSGLSRYFQGKFGSATFPHGAIILWDRDILEKLFWGHPGYKISEDWYFGHTARAAGYRIEFCTHTFVETETPPSLFIPVKSTRGGFGEMTVWKQRFYRWNFFYIYRVVDDMNYILFAWRLGWLEWITKLFVFLEVYDTFIYFSRPILLPIALYHSPAMVGIMTAALLGAYVFGAVFFNMVHLRYKKEMIAWRVIPVYFVMKFALAIVNTLSVYYSIYAYADYFSVGHPRVTESLAAVTAAKTCLDEEAEKKRVHEEIREVSETDEEAEMTPAQSLELAIPAPAMVSGNSV